MKTISTTRRCQDQHTHIPEENEDESSDDEGEGDS